jgi:hypothetical protein
LEGGAWWSLSEFFCYKTEHLWVAKEKGVKSLGGGGMRDGKTKHHHRAVCRATTTTMLRGKKSFIQLDIAAHLPQKNIENPENTFLDFCCSELGMFFGCERRLCM